MESQEAIILIVGVLSVLLGLLVIAVPRMIAYIVGAYLVVAGGPLDCKSCRLKLLVGLLMP